MLEKLFLRCQIAAKQRAQDQKTHLNQKGQALAVVIMFPVVLLLVLLILHSWSLSSARSAAQISADNALRNAQNPNIEGADNKANAALNGVVEGISYPVPYLSAANRNPIYCQAEDNSGIASLDKEECTAEAQDTIAQVIIDEGNNRASVRVDVDIQSPVQGLLPSLNGVQTATACGPVNIAAWAPLRSAAGSEAFICFPRN